MKPTESTIDVAVIDYVNAWPLTYPLLRAKINHPFQIRCGVPSVCSRLLSLGRCDVALIPSIEFHRHENAYSLIRGISISSFGPVTSVLLCSRVPIENISNVSLDTASETSAALTQIILREKYGLLPVFQRYPVTTVLTRPLEFESFLVIGDQALKLPATTKYRYDLACEWNEWTNLPMVFAVWVSRKDCMHPSIERILLEAKIVGQKDINEIVNQWVSINPEASRSCCHKYLTVNLNYDLTKEHMQSMKLFFALADKLGIGKGQHILQAIDFSPPHPMSGQTSTP